MLSSLIRCWFWAHLISLIAIILQPSVPATILGRYSSISIIILVLFLVLTPAAYWGTRWLVQRSSFIHLSQTQSISLFVICLGLAIACWLPNIGVTSSYIIIRLYITFVLFTCIIWALTQLRATSCLVSVNLIMGCALLAFLLIAATRFPSLLWTDEGYMVTVTMGWTRLGQLTPLYLQPAPVQSFSSIYMLQSLWFRVFGVSLFSGRIFIFLIALLVLGIVYLTVHGMYSSTAAWSAVILGAGAFLFQNYLRTDIGVAFFIALAFLLYILAERKRITWLHILVGITVGISMDGHPNAYRFGLGFGLAYIVEYALQLFQRRRFFIDWRVIYLMMGGLIGVGAYFFFYSHITTYFTSAAGAARFALSFDKAWDILVNQFNTALRTTPLLIGGALVGIVIAVRRHSSFDRLLLIVLVVSMLSIAILYGYTRTYYLIHNLVPLILLSAGAFWSLEQLSTKAITTGVNIGLAVVTCALVIGGMLSSEGQGYNRILTFADRIREVVPREASFVGVDPLYIPMYDYPHFIEMNGPAWVASRTGAAEADVWNQLSPDAVAVVRNYPIPPFPTMLTYISEHKLELVRCWTDDEIGEVDLYMKPAAMVVPKACGPVDEK